MKKISLLLSLWLLSCSFSTEGLDPDTQNESCGNGTLEAGEECDRGLFGTSCGEMGFQGGYLGCSACQVDNSTCTAFCGECQIGSSRCLDNKVFQCTDAGDGCGVWSEASDCADQFCKEIETGALCDDTCESQCTQGEYRCDDAQGGILQCAQAANDPNCSVWQSAQSCAAETLCVPLDGIPTCLTGCRDQCSEGEERCSEDGLARELCAEGPHGCFIWSPSPCPAHNVCQADETGTTLCTCTACEVGSQRCKPGGNEVEECNPYGDGCSQWEASVQCDGATFEQCLEEGDTARCQAAGDTCDTPFPVTEIPITLQFSDFTTSFADSIPLSDESCGPPMANSNDVVLAVDLIAGDSINIVKTNGLDIRIKILRACEETAPCEAFGDNQLEYTPMESGQYLIVVEKRGNAATSDFTLGITTSEIDICTDMELESNNDFTEANPYPGNPAVWCSRISTVDDVDCVEVQVAGAGYLLETSTSSITDDAACPGNTHIQLYTSMGALFAENDNGGIDLNCSELSPLQHRTMIDLPTDTYTLCVNDHFGAGVYNVATHMRVITDASYFINTDFNSVCPPSEWGAISGEANSWTCPEPTVGDKRLVGGVSAGNSTQISSTSFDLSGLSHLVLSMRHSFNGLDTVLTHSRASIILQPEGGEPITVYSTVSDITNLAPLHLDLTEHLPGLSNVVMILKIENTLSTLSSTWEIDDLLLVGY